MEIERVVAGDRRQTATDPFFVMEHVVDVGEQQGKTDLGGDLGFLGPFASVTVTGLLLGVLVGGDVDQHPRPLVDDFECGGRVDSAPAFEAAVAGLVAE